MSKERIGRFVITTNGTYPSLLLFFCGVHVAQSLVFCVMFCKSLFVLFLLAIALSVIL